MLHDAMCRAVFEIPTVIRLVIQAATLCVLATTLIVVVPAASVAQRIIGEAAEGAETIKVAVESGAM